MAPVSDLNIGLPLCGASYWNVPLHASSPADLTKSVMRLTTLSSSMATLW
eukprot:CAMPEP_0171142488 /NCGR_PEP_ID=MMETSP0766_2-20121228/142568_1 /TAXON_ID=439317 /ORGANISM="Gambierdiscus australes, Strain CAWD 149" /LENGTH=49 /DNA_ID= /DNA_START= /DNA_END= /DNA_ORIENTATION=